MHPIPRKTTKERRHRLRFILLACILLIVAVRLALPYVLLRLVNDRLARMPGYTGHVQDLDLAILRGAYQLERFHLDKVDSHTQEATPFLAAHLIDLSVEWKALFHGSVVGELVVDSPLVRFTKEAVEPQAVQEDTTDLRGLLDDLMPIKINRLEFHNGTLAYLDPTSKPQVDVAMSSIELLVTNLRNSYDSAALLPSSASMTARMYGGEFDLNMRLNPLAPDPTLDMNAELKDMQLTRVNDFLQAYAKVDVNAGTFGLYCEFATRDRRFEGYVKPIIKDLDVLGQDDRDDNLLRKLWEGFAGTVGTVLTNPRKEQVATKIPFRGDLDGPRANVLYAVMDLLRNAFIQALQPSLDHEVNIQNVPMSAPEEKKGILQRLFDKGE